MKKILHIFIFGFIGACIRSLFYDIKFLNPQLPYSTLMVNLVGSFVLSFLTFLALKEIKLKEEIHIGFTTGFLGAFTTFSTFSKDTFKLLASGEIEKAIVYILVSLIGGLICVFLGYLLVDKLFDKEFIN